MKEGKVNLKKTIKYTHTWQIQSKQWPSIAEDNWVLIAESDKHIAKQVLSWIKRDKVNFGVKVHTMTYWLELLRTFSSLSTCVTQHKALVSCVNCCIWVKLVITIKMIKKKLTREE